MIEKNGIDDFRELDPPPIKSGQFLASLEYGTIKGPPPLFFIRGRDPKTRETIGPGFIMTQEQAVAMARSILDRLAPPVPFADPVSPIDPSPN